MGVVAAQMWEQTAAGYQHRDPALVHHLERRDDDLDALVDGMRTDLLRSDCPATVVIDAVLVGRFYERLGDHAVNLAGQVTYLVTGESVSSAAGV